MRVHNNSKNPPPPPEALQASKAVSYYPPPEAVAGTPLLLSLLGLLLYPVRKAFYFFLSHNLVSSHEELGECLVFDSLDDSGFDGAFPPMR